MKSLLKALVLAYIDVTTKDETLRGTLQTLRVWNRFMYT